MSRRLRLLGERISEGFTQSETFTISKSRAIKIGYTSFISAISFASLCNAVSIFNT